MDTLCTQTRSVTRYMIFFDPSGQLQTLQLYDLPLSLPGLYIVSNTDPRALAAATISANTTVFFRPILGIVNNIYIRGAFLRDLICRGYCTGGKELQTFFKQVQLMIKIYFLHESMRLRSSRLSTFFVVTIYKPEKSKNLRNLYQNWADKLIAMSYCLTITQTFHNCEFLIVDISSIKFKLLLTPLYRRFYFKYTRML